MQSNWVSNFWHKHFANDMFDISKRQKDFSFHLAIFQIEASYHVLKNAVQIKPFLAIFKIRRVPQAFLNVNG